MGFGPLAGETGLRPTTLHPIDAIHPGAIWT
jgi:hypothetical protein